MEMHLECGVSVGSITFPAEMDYWSAAIEEAGSWGDSALRRMPEGHSPKRHGAKSRF
ncbi:MAG: hypothetical protein AAF191_13965 [Verrucomicrobiota bacterium]